MEEDSNIKMKMDMYEAQAIVIEKEAVIKRLEQEKTVLEAKVRQLQGEPTTSSNDKIETVLTAMKEMEKRMETMVNSSQNVENIMNRLDQLDQRMAILEEVIQTSKTQAELAKNTSDKMVKTEEKVGPRVDAYLAIGSAKWNFSFSDDFSKKKFKKKPICPPVPTMSPNLVDLSRHPAGADSSKKEDVLEEIEDKRKVTPEKLEKEAKMTSSEMSEETILIAGGERDGKMTDDLIILSKYVNIKKVKSEWKAVALKLPRPNAYGGAVCLNGNLYVFGGNGLKKKLYIYEKKNFTNWVELAEMKEVRKGISGSSLVFDGCIWVLGGLQSSKSVEKYCPEKKEWTLMPAMSVERQSAAAAVFNGKIVVCGGYNIHGRQKSVECFDPSSEIWTPLIDLPVALSGHSTISYEGCLFVLGGGDGKKDFNSVWSLNQDEDHPSWKDMQPMKVTHRSFSAVLMANELFVVGGTDSKKTVEIYAGGSWSNGPALPASCTGMSAVVIPANLAKCL